MIGLGVRKILWKKKFPFHVIKCFSFKEVPLQEKFLCSFTFNVMLSLLGFLQCFLLFSIYAQNAIFKKTLANKNTNDFKNSKQEYKQIPPFLPAWTFNFRNAFCIQFFICKEDLWGQIVQIFYFSHHWTYKTTDSHFINMLEKKHSLFPTHSIFIRVAFLLQSTEIGKPCSFTKSLYTSMQAHKLYYSVTETHYNPPS